MMKLLMRLTAASALLLAANMPAEAQQVVSRPTLTIAGAKQVIAGAVAEAKKANATGVIAVVDDGGNLMALERLDNTFAAGATVSIGKARTAALFKKPTKFFEDVIKNGRAAMTALPSDLFTPLQGGVPLMIDGHVVGGVGVSGASSALQDEEFAIAGANALNAAPASSTTEMPAHTVTHIQSAEVSAAFARGVPLVEKDQYKVHASRRDNPGQAEIHTADTDVFYVLEGSATFITGGTLVDPKTTADGEIRGSSIKGGDVRTLKKGDIIIVPAGVPHWFKEISSSGPMVYYVVKVTGDTLPVQQTATVAHH